MKFHLVTTYYHTNEAERAAENLECFENNISNPLIGKIHLFLQSRERPQIDDNTKVIFIEHNKRPTFSELISYANNLPPEDIKIISNSDIYFNDTLLLSKLSLKKYKVLALTRWDRNEKGKLIYYNNFKSQDVWIFRDILPEDIGHYYIGQHGCDNRLLSELKSRKISVSNPSLEITTIHLHKSNLRTYFDDPNYQRVPKPYEYSLPEFIRYGLYLDNQLLEYYFSARYRYYKSLSSNTLESRDPGFLSRFAALLTSKIWAFMFNFIRRTKSKHSSGAA